MTDTNKHILFKYASRSRPEKFIEGLESIINNLTDSENASVLVSLDKDDPRLKDYEELIKPYYEKIFIKVVIGISSNKINAINRDITAYKGHWDILVCMSDDMRFTAKGFDHVIRYDMSFRLNGHGVLHYKDPNQPDNYMTMSIISRSYYDLDGYIYNPSYKSLYADLEAEAVAKNRGLYSFIDVPIFVHLHPSLGLSDYDEQYRITESEPIRLADHDNYWNRKQNNFYL